MDARGACKRVHARTWPGMEKVDCQVGGLARTRLKRQKLPTQPHLPAETLPPLLEPQQSCGWGARAGWGGVGWPGAAVTARRTHGAKHHNCCRPNRWPQYNQARQQYHAPRE